MTGMKYIVFEKGGMEEAILFPQWWIHVDVAIRLGLRNVISAGSVNRAEDGRLQCSGKSTGLKVDSRPVEDLDLILRLLSFNV